MKIMMTVACFGLAGAVLLTRLAGAGEPLPKDGGSPNQLAGAVLLTRLAPAGEPLVEDGGSPKQRDVVPDCIEDCHDAFLECLADADEEFEEDRIYCMRRLNDDYEECRVNHGGLACRARAQIRFSQCMQQARELRAQRKRECRFNQNACVQACP